MSPKYDAYDYIIWLDMDFYKKKPNLEGIREVFLSTQDWDAVFAYGIASNPIEFWDWYAFRDKEIPFGPELLGDPWWHMKRNFSRSIGEVWYPVYSSFGGCGIYKKESLKGCKYSGVVTYDLSCLTNKIIKDLGTNHPIISRYLTVNKTLDYHVSIPEVANLKKHYFNSAILLENDPYKTVFRLNSYFIKFPIVCEHVTLHASMIIRGHDKLFINPRMLFYY